MTDEKVALNVYGMVEPSWTEFLRLIGMRDVVSNDALRLAYALLMAPKLLKRPETEGLYARAAESVKEELKGRGLVV